MARYIDADALIETMRNRYDEICETYGYHDLYASGYDDAVDAVENAPTADVAPRAEVEQLQAVNADLNESLRLAAEANKDLQAAIAEVRAEVARGFFEEIEEIRGEFLEGKNTGADVIVKLFLLKNKYTGG